MTRFFVGHVRFEEEGRSSELRAQSWENDLCQVSQPNDARELVSCLGCIRPMIIQSTLCFGSGHHIVFQKEGQENPMLIFS